MSETASPDALPVFKLELSTVNVAFFIVLILYCMAVLVVFYNGVKSFWNRLLSLRVSSSSQQEYNHSTRGGDSYTNPTIREMDPASNNLYLGGRSVLNTSGTNGYMNTYRREVGHNSTSSGWSNNTNY